MQIELTPFGTLEGTDIKLFTIRNARGTTVEVINYGAILKSVMFRDKNGRTANITLGFDTLADYVERNTPYFGATVGRYANRIAQGNFELDGVTYQLAKNRENNHLHGGNKGFSKVIWKGAGFENQDNAGGIFTYVSEDGEEGYPGTLHAKAIYTLNESDELSFTYDAHTDKPTPINLTNHAYWNLAGPGVKDVLMHRVTLHASKYLPVDESLIPTGELRDVIGSVMDFTDEHTIGERIGSVPGGYDHCYIVDRNREGLNAVAEIWEPESGRRMEVLSTEPGVQFYTGNFLDGIEGSGGVIFNKHDAFCLETQHFPDSVHHAGFPSVILKPCDKYFHKTVHRFSTT